MIRSRWPNVLRCRAQVDRGRVALTFTELGDTIFARWAADGRPTKRELKQALRCIGLGYRLKVLDGKVVYRAM